MTLHLLGLPFSETTKEWEAEAYTARTRVLASMMSRYGNVILYAGEANEATVTEHVAVVDRAWQRRHFPDFTAAATFSDYDPARPAWLEWNVLAALEIRKRARPGDILGITMGTSQRMVADLLRDLGLQDVEVGIGYGGIWAPFRVFESWAWRFYHSGRDVGIKMGQNDPQADLAGDTRNFDATIPRAYEMADFPAGDGKGGYYLYLGRVVNRKGPHIAAQVCQRIGAKLLVAGQGVKEVAPGRITADDGTVLEGDVEYAGVVNPALRAQLMGGAIATFCPTLYMEPFGGSHAESMLTGTPVIAAPWGVFRENILDGVTGYLCPTLNDFIQGAKDAGSLDRAAIRRYATGKFSTQVVGPQFDRYLNRLRTLRREGWYEVKPERMAA